MWIFLSTEFNVKGHLPLKEHPSKFSTPLMFLWWNRDSLHHKCETNTKIEDVPARNSNHHREHGALPPSQTVTMRPAYVGSVIPSEACDIGVAGPLTYTSPHSSPQQTVSRFRIFLACFVLLQHWICVLRSSKPRKPAKSQTWRVGKRSVAAIGEIFILALHRVHRFMEIQSRLTAFDRFSIKLTYVESVVSKI